MIQKFENHIKTNFPYLYNSKLLVAVSGGVDSMVLCELLNRLKIQYSIAHCNFNLRDKESDLDESFVIEFGDSKNIKVFTKRFKTKEFAKNNQISTQMAARDLRYQWFSELMENKFDYLLTAHHLNDNLETVLINFIRGTGLKGLTGIPEHNNDVVRPLLPFTRDEILDFVNNESIAWREDQSNSETKYLRNKLRHDLIPMIKEINPNWKKSFLKSNAILKGNQDILNDQILELKPKVYATENGISSLKISEVLKLSNPKAYLFELLKEFGFTEWNDIVDLLTAQTGKQILSKTHRVVKNRNELIISQIKPQESNQIFIEDEDSKIDFDGVGLSLENLNQNATFEKQNQNEIVIDKEKIKFPLLVRKWKNGDYFYPFGMNGKKKLSKYFKDEKFSLLEKENIWLLCSENDIVWIIGKRLDDRFKIDSNTKKKLRIKLSK